MSGRSAALWALVCVSVACERAVPPLESKTDALPPGIVARAGSADVHRETVERIAQAQSISAEEARVRAVQDALFALEALQALSAPARTTIQRGALGRALLTSLLLEAQRQGPPSPSELSELTQERWVDLDRPPAARVAHAVALRSQATDSAEARDIALAIAEAVQSITDPEAFLKVAKAVPSGAVKVRAERLPAITADGRGFLPESRKPAGTFDGTFAEAANALGEPGAQSGIVETRFGFHVLLLEARIPELRVSPGDRERLLSPEVVARRADQSRRALIERLSSTAKIEVARDFEARTAGLDGS